MNPHPNRKLEAEKGADVSAVARLIDDDEVDAMVASRVEPEPVDAEEEDDDIEVVPPAYGV